MTILIPVGRSWSAKVLLLPRSSSPLLTRLLSTQSNARVSTSQQTPSVSYRPQCSSSVSLKPLQRQQARNLAAAAAASTTGRPKAHTGRSTTAKGKAKKTSTSKSKAKSKKAKAKTAKPKANNTKAKPKKRELSEAGKKRKEAAERSALKKQALLREAPKALPDNAWTVFFVERGPKKGEALDKTGSRTKAIAQEYRNISIEERERLNRTANENKARNEAAYKEWVNSYTALKIKQANHARDLLRQDAKKNGHKTIFPHIKDDRLVKQPRNQYTLFLEDRYASGDLKGLSFVDATSAIKREWADLSPAEKMAYEERFAADRSRYQQEYRSVYGIDSPSAHRSSASSSASP